MTREMKIRPDEPGDRGSGWHAGVLHRPLRWGTVLLLGATTVALPTAAQAADGVSSGYRLGCTIYPEDATGSSTDPGGVAFDGDRLDITASPVQHSLSGSALAVDPGGGDDCAATVDYSDSLTVYAGTSGLAAGAVVPVEVSVLLDGALIESWDADGLFSTIAWYDARGSVRAVDCTSDGEVLICDTPLDFEAEHYHQVYAGGPSGSDPNGYVEASARYIATVETNSDFYLEDYVDETRPGHENDTPLCSAWPCSADENKLHPEPEPARLYTAPAFLVVGKQYSVDASLNVFAGAHDNTGAQASSAVDEFSLGITLASGFEGVDIAYASAGGGPVSPPDPMEELGEAITEIAVPAGIRNALQSKYDEALAGFAAGDTAAGCGALGALDNHVSAQAGKKIPTADAALLRDLVDRARAENGC